ncbi:MAG: copper amine oxidase N-terminal domain-containing protein [Clostridia bacterium]
MFKKMVAMACVVSSLLTQMAFTMAETDLRSPNADDFYSRYGAEKYADVFYNGEYLYYEDVQPLVLEGTTFVPIRAFAETLGAEVDFVYETFEVIILLGDDRISFIAGETDIYVNGELKVLPTETFIIEGRTMVPARLISEAFGLDVLWNNENRQVSIVDVEELKKELDTKYTLVQSALDMASMNFSGNSKLTGDITYTTGAVGSELEFLVDFTSVANSDVSLVEFEADCTINMDKYETMLEYAFIAGEIDELTYYILLEYVKVISEFDLDLIMDVENLDLYFSSSMMETLALFVSTSTEIDADTILKLSYADFLSSDEILDLKNQLQNGVDYGFSLEDMIDEIILSAETTNLFETNIYENAKYILDVFSDDNFTQKGNTYTINSNETLDVGEYDIEMTITKSTSGVITSYDFNITTKANDEKSTIILSQDSENQLSLVVYSDFLVDGELEIVELACNINRTSTTTKPSSIPTQNVVNILEIN